MFHLMTHSTHLWLYGIRHIAKNHSDSESGNPLPPLHGQLFVISSKGSFICTIHPRQDSTYHGLCSTSREALAGIRNSSMDPPWMSYLFWHPIVNLFYLCWGVVKHSFIPSWQIDLTTHHTMSERSTTELHLTPSSMGVQLTNPQKNLHKEIIH